VEDTVGSAKDSRRLATEDIMTSRQLARLTRYWQRKLGLRDWQISVEFARVEEMHDAGNVGECVAQLCDRTAHIRILRDSRSDYDIELSVVHELAHVLLPHEELMPRDRVKAKLFEAGIDQLASTLLGFKRGQPPRIQI